MRAVILHRGFKTWGGAEALALAQARDLRTAGVDVHLVALEVDAATWGPALDGLPFHQVPRRHWTDFPFLLDRRARLARLAGRVEATLRRLAPDVVLAHNPPAPALLGALDTPARKLWYCHEPPRGLYPRQTNRRLLEASRAGLLAAQQPLIRALRRDLGRDARGGPFWARRLGFDQEGVAALGAIAANSAYTRTSVSTAYGGRQAEVLYPAVGLAPAPHLPGIDRTGLQVMVQTRLELLKNVETVLRGFRLALARLGPMPRLHVVGDGSQRAALEALALELGLRDRVTFHGFLPADRLADLRRACDVFAFLPWDEPFGLVFPEAAAAGMLLVGPDHGGPWEILAGGEFGWCVAPHSPVALAEALVAAFRLPDGEAERLRWRAHEACQARFSPGVTLPAFRRWVAEAG